MMILFFLLFAVWDFVRNFFFLFFLFFLSDLISCDDFGFDKRYIKSVVDTEGIIIDDLLYYDFLASIILSTISLKLDDSLNKS